MRAVAFSLSAFLLIACSSSDPETLIREGCVAQGSGDSKEALFKFKKALERLAPEEPRFVDAKLGMIEALIAVAPKTVFDESFALVERFPQQVGEEQLLFIVSRMIGAGEFLEANAILRETACRFGVESPSLRVQFDRLVKAAENDEALEKTLMSLPGYLDCIRGHP